MVNIIGLSSPFPQCEPNPMKKDNNKQKIERKKTGGGGALV